MQSDSSDDCQIRVHEGGQQQDWVGHTTKQLLIFKLDCLFNNLGGLRPPRWLNQTSR